MGVLHALAVAFARPAVSKGSAANGCARMPYIHTDLLEDTSCQADVLSQLGLDELGRRSACSLPALCKGSEASSPVTHASSYIMAGLGKTACVVPAESEHVV